MWVEGAIFLSYVVMYWHRIWPFLVYVVAPIVTGALVIYKQYDDAWWEQNAAWTYPLPRYVETGENIVYDSQTGLTWIEDPSLLGGVWGTPGNPATMTWYEAVEACMLLNYAGHKDWRLPNANELDSITDFGKSHPALDKTKFKNSGAIDYLSGSITNFGCENYFQTDPLSGRKTWDQDKNKKKLVRPVRDYKSPYWEADLGTGTRYHHMGRIRAK